MFRFFRRRPATADDHPPQGSRADSISPEGRARLAQFADDFNGRPRDQRGPFVEPGSDEYDLWKAGKLVPWFITNLLDAGRHVGPAVDIACGAQEPAVDRWEAGRVYPSWDQTVALARFLNVRVRVLAHPDAQPCHHKNRPLHRIPETAILSFEPAAVEAATATASTGHHQDGTAASAERIITGVLSEHTADYRIAPDGSDRDVVVVCDGRDCEDWVGADSHEHAEHATAIVVAALTTAGKTITE